MKFEAKNKWVFLTKIGERVCVVFAADAAMTSCHNTYFALKTLASFFLDYFLSFQISLVLLPTKQEASATYRFLNTC